MRDALLEFGRNALTGQSRGIAASVFRAGASFMEPFYSAVMWVRNTRYDTGRSPTCYLGRPTISVGNVTTGGTGKTPVVIWLANRLRDAGHHPAVLLRGYASKPGQPGDEQLLLDHSLNSNQPGTKIPVMADPSRIAGASAVLKFNPGVDVFVLDDGFQHRRAKRNFDLVLINATDPFGGGHVLPRGLLREPLTGLRRADAFLITRASLTTTDRLQQIENDLKNIAGPKPIYRADHSPIFEAGQLRGTSVVAVSGIGDPGSFERQLEAAGATITDRFRFADHHDYTAESLSGIQSKAAGRLIVTTGKDWVKIEPQLMPGDETGWATIGLAVRFHDQNADRLFDQIKLKLSDHA